MTEELEPAAIMRHDGRIITCESGIYWQKPFDYYWSEPQVEGVGTLVKQWNEKVENYKVESLETLFAGSDIIQNLPLGVNAVRAICNNCGFTGFVDKQVTDAYEPYCTRCGKQAIEEGVEESLIVKERIKELIQRLEVED